MIKTLRTAFVLGLAAGYPFVTYAGEGSKTRKDRV